jgi:membrane-associated phospholipid phosphatase
MTAALLVAFAACSGIIALLRGVPAALVISAIVFLVVLLSRRVHPEARAWALFPLICFPLLYAQVGMLDAGRLMHDPVVIAWEAQWFGVPWQTWRQHWPSPVLSTLLHLCYLAFYPVVYLPPLYFAWRARRDALDAQMLAFTVVLLSGLAWYLVWPVEGPRYRWPTPADVGENPARLFARMLLEHFSARGTAFPSSHVSITVVQTAVLWRWQRRVAPTVACITVGLAVAAVYGGFHYLIDVVAGAALGGIVAWLVVFRAPGLPRALRAGLVALATLGTSGCATTAPSHRFYNALPYGSERQFNPVSQFVNEGFDLLRMDDSDRRLAQQPFRVTARNIRNSIWQAPSIIDEYGWSTWASHELLPLTLKSGGGGQWVPNYQFHLLGSGMVSARLTEWFEQHDVSHPGAWSFATMMSAHLLNEMTERAAPRSIDALTDLLVFDPAGFFLFRAERVQRLFSGPMQLTNWSMQPTLNQPNGTIENVGQEYVLRVRLPRSTRWRGLYMFGVSTLFGVSRDIGDGRALSFGVGADAVQTSVIDAATDQRTVTLSPNAGIFFDRNGSLLASLLVRGGNDTYATVNIYPGALGLRHMPVGVWGAALRGGGARVGLSAPFGLGIGYGQSNTASGARR